jgi:hypothetical protein
MRIFEDEGAGTSSGGLQPACDAVRAMSSGGLQALVRYSSDDIIAHGAGLHAINRALIARYNILERADSAADLTDNDVALLSGNFGEDIGACMHACIHWMHYS